MVGQLHDTAPARRADYGAVRLGQRDIDGLILCAEHYGAPYDLLAAALGAQPARLRGITARWRRAGYSATGLTPAGMTAAGFAYPATRPSLARLAHIRAAHPGPGPAGSAGHLPDAEIHWPSTGTSPHAGQVWAVEVELTPKPLAAPPPSWPGCSADLRGTRRSST
jgi:hypothetical protein